MSLQHRRAIRSSLTVSELRSVLEELEEKGYSDTAVMMSSDYGDHNHTIQLLTIKEVVGDVPRESAYSDTGLCLNRSTCLEYQALPIEDGDEEIKVVIILT